MYEHKTKIIKNEQLVSKRDQRCIQNRVVTNRVVKRSRYCNQIINVSVGIRLLIVKPANATTLPEYSIFFFSALMRVILSLEG